jgi:hypothetical protein
MPNSIATLESMLKMYECSCPEHQAKHDALVEAIDAIQEKQRFQKLLINKLTKLDITNFSML